jgi:hypothetical protein
MDLLTNPAQNSQNIINACSESKRTFENFRASLILENKSHTLYIRNFTSLVRTFEQGRERAPQGFRAIFNDKIFVPENVQNIAIDTRYSSYDNIAAAHHDDRMQRDPTREPHTPANTVRFLAMFQELKTLTVVMKTGRYKDANPHPMEFMPGYIGMCVATTRYSVEDIVRTPFLQCFV